MRREGVFSYQSVLENLVELALAAQSADCTDDVIGMRQWRRSLLERLGKDNVVPIRHSSTGPVTGNQLQQFSSDVTQKIKQLITKANGTGYEGETSTSREHLSELLTELSTGPVGPLVATSADLVWGHVTAWLHQPPSEAQRKPIIVTGAPGYGKSLKLCGI
ncbi:hypothetical protein FJT64_019102 [Amphibalanus amphitrite]|uniref:Uncharacterized protein n=1 Tax=Amphibalanus amphitrite TaxID=1232801 RepID=A0A6A4WQR8_AMPAM|nr:hypothetical protein FJT64_019102 [Amphibalanus amphitrite]